MDDILLLYFFFLIKAFIYSLNEYISSSILRYSTLIHYCISSIAMHRKKKDNCNEKIKEWKIVTKITVLNCFNLSTSWGYCDCRENVKLEWKFCAWRDLFIVKNYFRLTFYKLCCKGVVEMSNWSALRCFKNWIFEAFKNWIFKV